MLMSDRSFGNGPSKPGLFFFLAVKNEDIIAELKARVKLFRWLDARKQFEYS